MDEKMAAALVGGGASLLVAVLGQIFNPLAQKRLERYKSAIQGELEHQKAEFQQTIEAQKSYSQIQLETLKADLMARGSAQSARRDYEYEARKRLYAEVEPLFFALYEASEECFYRIRSLVRSARQGRLGIAQDSWMEHDGYYLISTAFKIVLPSVIYRLIQRRLTFVDLSLDEIIRLRYLIIKNFAHSFTDHFDFAALPPSLPYHPTWDSDASSLENRRIKRHQGIITGDFENILDEMIVHESDGLRPISLGEFEKRIKTSSEESYISTLLRLYRGFAPNTDPVLARMLLAQAGLSYLFMSTFKGTNSIESLRRSASQFCTSQGKNFIWNKEENLTENLTTVEPYILDCLNWIETAP